MSLLSLVPVFGAALVWGPVAIDFLANGVIWKGIALMVYGVMVIGLIENITRPWLVGQATRIPHYVVLISTIDGTATFGIQGFIMGPVIAAMFIAVWTTFLAKAKSFGMLMQVSAALCIAEFYVVGMMGARSA
ncbi:protein of unknown function DUF20 [Ruegeria marina]|uniref:Uncharacterized protein n=2 Tax=Ruegeria marina TaxID=639004 RepID=A0A1G6YIE7_9RHOB|nr:protein of unknown function DUF20 [Ruegeria marina]